jgi:hypothetical protein
MLAVILGLIALGLLLFGLFVAANRIKPGEGSTQLLQML